jgi:hypothetical protein
MPKLGSTLTGQVSNHIFVMKFDWYFIAKHGKDFQSVNTALRSRCRKKQHHFSVAAKPCCSGPGHERDVLVQHLCSFLNLSETVAVSYFPSSHLHFKTI